jgi:hypothetical protein
MNMGTLDEEIARHLAAAASSGELRAAPSYGKPMPPLQGWDETPQEFRQGFKILKDAGFAPPEIELFHERARLRAALEASDGPEQKQLMTRLSELEQKLSLRLEALRTNGRV